MAAKGTMISRELAWKIKQEYERVDSTGRRIWTQAKLAAYYGVSETTVFRAAHNLGAYGRVPLPEPKPTSELDAEAKASAERFLREHPELVTGTVSVLDKMGGAIQAAREKETRGDTMLDELKETK